MLAANIYWQMYTSLSVTLIIYIVQLFISLILHKSMKEINTPAFGGVCRSMTYSSVV